VRGGPGDLGGSAADGLMVFPAEIARQALFNDCSDERAQDGLQRLQPQSFIGIDQTIEVAAWTQLPSIYVRGTQDLVPRALAAGFLEQCEAVIDLPTGHCPQWSRPELVAELLHARIAGTVHES
jgi:pimeloyl-ACP methyl ester carboxylesterase